jgi:P-type E1-E2 ATPase
MTSPGAERAALRIEIPGREALLMSSLVLDLNGTIAVDGVVIPGVETRLGLLHEQGWTCYLLTADTRGRAQATAESLQVTLHRLTPGQEAAQKARLVETLGAGHVVAIGAGLNDAEMLRKAAIGIAVLEEEGAAVAALLAADLVVPGIDAALDLLLKPQRLVASLRR